MSPASRLLLVRLSVFVLFTLLPRVAIAQIDVLTNRYDGARTGANLRETQLTTANVNVQRFGKLFSYPVDGAVYAQPLYVSGLTVSGITRNVLYVATMHDKVYAFDADSTSGTPLWSRDFTSPPAVTAVPITDIVPANLNIVGNVGIQSTPVIDRATHTIYLVARTKENGAYFQRLHALDIATGVERPGSPVVIHGSVPGTALDAVNGVVSFDPKMHVQRAGLALTNGVVLVAWAAHEDATPSHGWVMAFDAATLARTGILAITPDAYLGGVWQGGRAPAVDTDGNAYFATGNGLWNGTRNFGNSLLKLRAGPSGLSLLDYFTPANEATLTAADWDLSGSGFTILPGTNLLLGGGKEGVLYLLNGSSLGRKQTADAGVVQRINLSGGHVMGGPVFWESSVAGALVYNWSEDDELKAYAFANGRLGTIPHAQGAVRSPGHPGGSLTVSANSATAGSGIVWASMNADRDATHGLSSGILRAFDAETLQELWNSNVAAARDGVGTLMKFVPPTVANGRVYIPNHDNLVLVYGLLPSGVAMTATPANGTIAPGSSATFTIAVSAQGDFSGSIGLSATSPTGWGVTFSPSTLINSGTSTMMVTVPANATSGQYGIVVMAVSGAISQSVAIEVTVGSTTVVRPIGIDFVGSAAAMAAIESAGVFAQTHWNAASGAASPGPLTLTDGAGTATVVTATWSSNNTWSTPTVEQPGNARLMKGYLDSASSSTSTVTVTGLSAGAYDVYVYIDGDNRAYTRSGSYTIAVPGAAPVTVDVTDPASTNFSGTFVVASNGVGNYLRVRINGSAFSVSATPLMPTSGTRRAPINAIQIVPVVSTARRAIAIDFVGKASQAMGSTEAAGVVPQGYWSAASGAASAAPLGLVDEGGNQTPATVTWNATGTWALPVTETAGNVRMMRGYLDTTSSSTTTVTVANLPADTYDVYVYLDGANSAYARTGQYTVTTPTGSTGATATDAASANYTSTFVLASNSKGNYLKFRLSGDRFTLTAKPLTADSATLRAPVNGIQIVPVP